ncbi:MAG TPA: hypothetical protein DEB09_04700 [Candidatus Magasanikbacteria bacterium]|nr:hypothetical protein [Candidatus Magasanikbacteria bacterium]
MVEKLTDEKIKKILVGETYLSEKDIKEVEQGMQETGMGLAEYLVEGDFITKDILGQALAEYYDTVYVNLSREKIDQDLLQKVPELIARSKGVIAFLADDKGIKVAMLNPADLDTIHVLEKLLGNNIEPLFMTQQDFEEAMSNYKLGLKDEFNKILVDLQKFGLNKEKSDDVVVSMVDTLLKYGHQNRASDIHIEPYNEKLMVRFRIDGIMHDVLEVPKEFSEVVLTRIKILSKMRTDEHRAAQDGKLRFKSESETVDVRVSVVPTTLGENVVMRILSARSRSFGLSDLGLANSEMKKVQKAIKHPHGMFLVTGPTGSGKTTTLYAILKLLNRRDVNIATIEDPVEYDMEGITQIQVNVKTNLTFANGLRSIVRQDPNVIMVGEIRDQETADIAVNSALTGHLVLSTLHTNDAATTLPRLLDMDIEPFLVASTVNVAIAQRLVRKICSRCRTSYEMSEIEKKSLDSDSHIKSIFTKKAGKKLEKLRLYKGAGCDVCNHTGYKGRVGVFEILEMSEEIKNLVLQHASSQQIMETAKAQGMVTMLEDGIDKVLNGVTTLEEVLRVTRE